VPDVQDLGQTTHGHMSDADRLTDALCSAKELAILYARAALDSSNNGVREFFLAMNNEETHNQEVLLSFLRTRGFYPVPAAPESRVEAVRSRYQEMHDQMGLSDTPSSRRYKTADPKLPPASIQDPKSFAYKDRH
jgi:spore coat protein CotF